MQDGADQTTSDGRKARESLSEISRGSRKLAVTNGIVALSMISVLITVGEVAAGALVILTTALLFFALGIYQAINFSPATMGRLERFSEQIDGRFTPWKTGAGDGTPAPFTAGPTTDRFAVVNYVQQGMPIEIGHLLSQMTARKVPGLRNINTYITIGLPRRLPHMVIDFGHLTQISRLRLLPTSWHRSQRLDVGGGRRFRLYVATGRERLARAFFTPEVLNAFLSVGQSFDVEIKANRIYLFSKRSIASGSDRRLQRQQALIDGLVQSLADPQIADLLRHQSRGRDRLELRTDMTRGLIIFWSGIVAVIAVISVIALYALGLLEF